MFGTTSGLEVLECGLSMVGRISLFSTASLSAQLIRPGDRDAYHCTLDYHTRLHYLKVRPTMTRRGLSRLFTPACLYHQTSQSYCSLENNGSSFQLM